MNIPLIPVNKLLWVSIENDTFIFNSNDGGIFVKKALKK